MQHPGVESIIRDGGRAVNLRVWACGAKCAFCNENVKKRSNHKGHRHYVSPRVEKGEYLSTMINRASKGEANADNRLAARDACMEAEYPRITEYLVERTFADGSERETATLLIFAAEGVWKVCLNDRAEGRALWASGSTYGDAMTVLEDMIASGRADWRAVRQFKKK